MASLPLGAVKTDDGEVVVPASRRADGSIRKPIRIRQGYVPQDEVPKYKTVAQRRREQEAKDAAGRDNYQQQQEMKESADEELSLTSLSLESKPAASTEREQRAPRQQKQQQQRASSSSTTKQRPATASQAAPIREEGKQGDRSAELKQELTRLNKLLKEISKLEDKEEDATSPHEKKKLERKQELQSKRSDIIAELNGATVRHSSSNSASSKKKFVAIDL